MPNSRKTKLQLIEENAALRRRITELERRSSSETDQLAASPELRTDALHHTANLFQTLMAILPEAVMLSDLSGRIEFANAQTARRHGYDRAESLLGLNGFDLIAPDQRQQVAERVHEAVMRNDICRLEVDLIGADGQLFPATLSATALYDAQGLPQAILSLTHDITAYKQAEAALRQSEEQYRFLVNNSSDYIARFSRDGLLLFGSESAQHFHGYALDETISTPGIERVHPEDRDRARQTLKTIVDTGSDQQAIWRVKRKDGAYMWVELSGRRVYNAAGEPEAIVVQRDITTRKQLEETLHASEEKFRNVIEQASEAIVLFDEESVCVEVNAALERLTGVAREEWLGLTAWEISQHFLPPAQHTPEMAARFKTMAQAIANSQTAEYGSPLEYSIQRPDGATRNIRMTIFPIHTARGNMLGSILIDITDRKQAEEQIRRLNFELEQGVAERTMELQTVNEALHEDIRQRQRIEEMLRRAEQRYHTLFDSAGDAIFILTLTGQIEEVNRAACERLGYARDELLQMHIADLNVPEQRPHVAARLERTRHQESHSFETVHQRRDGTLLHVEVNSRVVEYAGQPAFLSIVRDITERKQIEETLRRSEASLAEAQRIAHFGSWTWDLVTGKLQCSDEMFRLVGLRPQTVEVTQEVFLNFLHPDDVAGILQRIQYVSNNAPLSGLEHRLVRSTGEIRHVYSRVKVYRDEHGQPLRLLGSTQDITDRKQAELALRQYADEQSALYEIALRLSAQLNTHELLQLLVEQAVTLLGVQTGGLYLYDALQDRLVLTQTIGFFSEYADATLRPGEGLSGRAFQTRQVLRVPSYETWEGRADLFKNDRRLKSVIAVPLLGKHAVLGVLIMADYEGKPAFSDHAARLAELFAAQAASALENAYLYEAQQEQYRRLQDAQARLIQSEKMSALGRLIASISHEINNPLQAVQGCLTLIREGVEEALPRLSGVEVASWLRDLDVATAEVQRIAAIVQRLRDFYRPARPGSQTTNVSAAIDSVLLLTAKQLQHSGIAVEHTAATEPPISINTNADQLRQVVLNLVLNAIDAMPDGGTLRVAASPESLWLGDRALPAIRLDFTDTGLGIPPEHLSHIFEPFFTTKDTGSGLGLSISYELVKALGGDLSVVSQVGVGTTFTVRLPLEPNYKTGSAL